MAKADGSLEEGEKLMPDVRVERTFECGVCGETITAKAQTAVCTGTRLGVLVRLPDGQTAVYTDGSTRQELNEDGEEVEAPWRVDGEVVKVNGQGHIFSADGKRVLNKSDKWELNPDRTDRGHVPGEHGGVEMKEVK